MTERETQEAINTNYFNARNELEEAKEHISNILYLQIGVKPDKYRKDLLKVYGDLVYIMDRLQEIEEE